MSAGDPREPEDGPAPECPIEALADALESAYADGLERKLGADWSAMANELARELRRHGYMLAVQAFRDHRDLGLKDYELANLVESKAPGEAE